MYDNIMQVTILQLISNWTCHHLVEAALRPAGVL